MHLKNFTAEIYCLLIASVLSVYFCWEALKMLACPVLHYCNQIITTTKNVTSLSPRHHSSYV